MDDVRLRRSTRPIADACARGYAETDPSADLDGARCRGEARDPVRARVRPHASPPATIETRSAASVLPDDFLKARQRGGTIRQIARAEYDRGAGPAWWRGSRRRSCRQLGVRASRRTAERRGRLPVRYAGEITMTGQGAGGDATAVAAHRRPHRHRARPGGDRAGAGAERAAENQRTDRITNSRRPCERAYRTAVSSVQGDVSGRSHLRVRQVPRSARAGLRLRAIKLTREEIERRPKNLWRYRELLPITGEPKTGFHSGFTPLVRCTRLAERLGVRELYIKDDSVNHPTLSYKDRVVSVAATRAVELGLDVLACASTGNLANSVAAHAARLGLECCVFIPDNLEAGKVLGSAIFGPTILAIAGNYDDVNRLCTQVADRYGWGFVNINLRSYYAEGAKTLRVRDRRAARMAIPAARRVAGRRRHAAAAHRARLPRASADRARRRRAAAHSRGAGRRLRAGRRRDSRAAPSIPNPYAPTRSRSRSRSAIRPTATRCCRRCARPAARARP